MDKKDVIYMGVIGEIASLSNKVVGNIQKVPGRVSGEISKLRVKLSNFRINTGSIGGGYKLGSSKTDYKLARELYNNEADNYKLGAWCAKPVINTCVGFMGVPRFKAVDPDAQEVLDAFHSAYASLQQQTHRDALRDGDCWVWLTREEDEESRILYPEAGGTRIVYNIIPPEKITNIKRHPTTGKPIEYTLVSTHEWLDESGSKKTCKIIEIINKDTRTIKIDGDSPADLESGEFNNHWGFLPIEQFSNEKDVSSANGRSDLEPIEPFMKAYHDVMLHAIKGSKNHSTPRLKLFLKDVGAFLRNNFGVTDPVEFAKKGGTINLEGKELLMFAPDEDGQYIEVKSATGDAQILLKLLFYCIVDVSETPEFAFGTHTPSSQASVKEQMPVLIRRVARKREHFSGSWERLARMVLAMHSISTGKKFTTHEVELIWDEIDPRDDQDIATALFHYVQALAMATNHYLISQEAAVNFLAAYIDTMSDYVSDDPEVPGEREKIIRDRIRNARLEDGDLAEKEVDLITKALAELDSKAG